MTEPKVRSAKELVDEAVRLDYTATVPCTVRDEVYRELISRGYGPGSSDGLRAVAAALAAQDMEPRRCNGCKHWGGTGAECPAVTDDETIYFGEDSSFYPPANFGCEHWEAKP